jgi:hypothetical protein
MKLDLREYNTNEGMAYSESGCRIFAYFKMAYVKTS